MKAELKWLADLQEALGVWHDRQVLNQAVARTLARPEFLLNELQGARILLTELEKDRSHEAEEVEEILRLASNHPVLTPLTPNPSPLA